MYNVGRTAVNQRVFLASGASKLPLPSSSSSSSLLGGSGGSDGGGRVGEPASLRGSGSEKGRKCHAQRNVFGGCASESPILAGTSHRPSSEPSEGRGSFLRNLLRSLLAGLLRSGRVASPGVFGEDFQEIPQGELPESDSGNDCSRDPRNFSALQQNVDGLSRFSRSACLQIPHLEQIYSNTCRRSAESSGIDGQLRPRWNLKGVMAEFSHETSLRGSLRVSF